MSTSDVGKKKKNKKKKQDPLGETYVSPRDVGKKTRPMWGRRDSMSPLLRDKQYCAPPTGLVRRGLLMPLPLLRGDTGAYPVPPDKKGGAYCCPSLQSPPVKGRHRSSSHVPLGSSPMLLPVIEVVLNQKKLTKSSTNQEQPKQKRKPTKKQ